MKVVTSQRMISFNLPTSVLDSHEECFLFCFFYVKRKNKMSTSLLNSVIRSKSYLFNRKLIKLLFKQRIWGGVLNFKILLINK